MDEITIHKIGSTVGLGVDPLIPATVVAACIGYNNKISYQVTWWEGRVRHLDWVEAFEVSPQESTKTRVGFRS